MWYDELPADKSWAALWWDYIRCWTCSGIRTFHDDCPACGSPSYANNDRPIQINASASTVEEQPDVNLHSITVSVDARPVKLHAETTTGAGIRAAAIAQGMQIRPSFALHEKLPNETCRLIGDSDVVHLRELLEFTTISEAFMGAEGRHEDWIYLQMLEREWKRPVNDADRLSQPDPTRQPSPRATIVVLFWSYFETRVERLLRAGMSDVPSRITEDVLSRYSSIGSRLDRLYRLLFETTFRADLAALGYEDVGQHLAHVQERRNAFAHGDPRAIDEALVTLVVDNLKREHESWIAVFNRRGARPLSRPTA